ncbi:MAG TPA: hypothetical protein V6C93_06250, partial [Allocoleopsis sp.]
GSPPCYVVDSAFLTQDQVDRLAQQLFEMWREETSLEEAKRYIINSGLPLKTDWFNGASTSSPAVLFGLMDDEGFGPKREDEEYWEEEEFREFREDEDDEDDDYVYFGEGELW